MPTLDETGTWAGGWAWAELRLFEVVGGWVAAAPEPAAKALLAAQSRHHAERAEAWLGHRPVVAGRDPEDLVVPSSEGVAAALAALADPEPAGTAERLAALVRVVLPRLATAYQDRLDVALAHPITDEALARSLRWAVADTLEDWVAAERLLQSLLRTGDDVAKASAHAARVESLLVT